MELTGGCHCGAVRYAVSGEPEYVAYCHCGDCRRASGAPVVVWAAFKREGFSVSSGQAREYSSNGEARRWFCERCGSGLYYQNDTVLPGLVDIQVASLDDPERVPPAIHVQTAERIGWIEHIGDLPQFERYPSAEH